MSTDDLSPFESPRALLNEANRKINEFAERRWVWSMSDPYESVEIIDNYAREKVICFQLRERIPIDIRLLAYGIINNLRDALDHATCDAALLTGTQDVKRVHFPIGKSPDDLKGEIKRRLQKVNPDIVKFITALNVCETGNPRLYAVLSLAGPNKHQRIVGVRIGDNIAFENLNPFMRPEQIKYGPRWIAAHNRLEVLRIRDGTEYEFKLHTILEICLGNGQAPLDRAADSILSDTARVIDSIILGLEAEARRISGS